MPRLDMNRKELWIEYCWFALQLESETFFTAFLLIQQLNSMQTVIIEAAKVKYMKSDLRNRLFRYSLLLVCFYCTSKLFASLIVIVVVVVVGNKCIYGPVIRWNGLHSQVFIQTNENYYETQFQTKRTSGEKGGRMLRLIYNSNLQTKFYVI